LIVPYINQLFRHSKGQFDNQLKQLEYFVKKGKLQEALYIVGNIEKSRELDLTDRLRNQIIKSLIVIDMGIFDKGILTAEQAFKKSQKIENPLLGVDAIISKAIALMLHSRLDECLEEIDQGENLLRMVNDVQQSEINYRSASLDYIKGVVYRKKGDLERAYEFLENCLAIRQELGDQHGLADTYNVIGSLYLYKGNLDKALDYYNKSLNIFEELENIPPKSKLLNNIGLIYWQKGDLDKALEYYHKSFTNFQKIGNRQHFAISLSNIGLVYWNMGELNLALDYYESSITILVEQGSKSELANVYNNIGVIYKDKGELDLSLDYHQMSLTINKELGNKQQIATSFLNIGEVYQYKGNLGIARKFYMKSYELFEDIGNNLDSIYPIFNLIKIAIYEKLNDEAQQYLQKLKEINEYENNKLIDLSYRLAKALILKTSDRVIKKAEAQHLLQKITEEEVTKFDLTVDAMVNLCDLLLLELRNSGSDEVLKELKVLLSKLLLLAENQHSNIWLINTYLLQFKLSMLELDIENAQLLLTKAHLIAKEKGLRNLELIISSESDLLLSQLNKLEKISKLNPSMSEMHALIQLDDLIERMIHRRIHRDEEEMYQYAEKAKYLLEKLETS
jgi:tetratricopeptide (TPR) repeat protein